MPIDFNCPLCNHPYRGLKDALAGKRATCKNPACRQVIVIPKPVTVPDVPQPTIEELEAAALSALADEAPKEQEQAPTEKVIPMTCSFCDHKWTEPLSKAGKNTLCPNPECRQRQKVPDIKIEEQKDWRQSRSKLPSGAKQNFEKLEGVEDAAEAKFVTGTALREAGATGVEIEPRSLKQKLVIAFVVFACLGAFAFGLTYTFRSRSTGQDEQLITEARKLYEESSKELPEEEAAYCSCLLNMTCSEYALRHNDSKKLKEAQNLLSQARKDLEPTAGLERQSLAAELALTTLAFGGTEEEAKTLIRLRWQPDLTANPKGITGTSVTVLDALRNTLGVVSGDYDFRIALARRLTRELVKRGQAPFATNSLHLELFNDSERDEARAVIALEVLRLDRESAAAISTANGLWTDFEAKLKGDKPVGVTGNPFPASAHTLFVTALKNKGFLGQPPAVGNVSDALRLSHVGILLLDGNYEAAITLAQRPESPESQFKSLLLCAEWMPAPAPALDAALQVVANSSAKRDVTFSQSQILRFSQIAAAGGSMDQARKFVALLTDEGQKNWATADLVRFKLAASTKEKPEPTPSDLPEDQKKVKVGHAWSVYWQTRRLAELSGDRAGEKKAVMNMLPTLRPFGLAGVALGLQDLQVRP